MSSRKIDSRCQYGEHSSLDSRRFGNLLSDRSLTHSLDTAICLRRTQSNREAIHSSTIRCTSSRDHLLPEDSFFSRSCSHVADANSYPHFSPMEQKRSSSATFMHISQQFVHLFTDDDSLHLFETENTPVYISNASSVSSFTSDQLQPDKHVHTDFGYELAACDSIMSYCTEGSPVALGGGSPLSSLSCSPSSLCVDMDSVTMELYKWQEDQTKNSKNPKTSLP